MIPFIDLEGGFLTENELLFLAGASGGGVAHTIINNPATFTTDLAKPLKRLLIPFTPVQTGTGTPAPDNVRPITGWTGLNINRVGVNAFDGVLEQGALDGNGDNTPSSTNLRSKNFIPVIPGARYKPVFTSAGGGSNMELYQYRRDKTYKKDAWVDAGGFINVDADVYFVRFYMDSAWTSASEHEVGINYPASETEFAPYNGASIPVSWQTDAGTVYGGALDALTGVLTVEWACITDSGTEEIWSISDVSGFTRVAISKDKFPNAPKNNSTANLFVNYMKASNWSAAEWQAFIGSTGNFLAYVDATTFPDKDAWIAYLAEHPIQICYELETPFTVQLDPVALSTLKGDNVIWTDTNGDNTITYLKRT